jgi:hypothetical protein
MEMAYHPGRIGLVDDLACGMHINAAQYDLDHEKGALGHSALT